MAVFTTKTWADRNVEHTGRRILEPVSGLTNGYDVTRSEGTVYVEGDLANATNLNALEGRIEDGFDAVSTWTSGTLTAGQTSITISDARITGSTTQVIDIATKFGVVPSAEPTATSGQIVIPFSVQATDIVVKIKPEV